MRWFAVLTLCVANACIPEEGPLMLPGEDCIGCHDGGEARAWTAAGTVFQTRTSGTGSSARGARVHLRDANGRSITLETNQAGNFYTAERLRFPLRARLEQDGVVREMTPEVEYGGCNHCHTIPPEDLAPGRLSVHE